MTDNSARAHMLIELGPAGDTAIRFAELFSVLIADPFSGQIVPVQSREKPSGPTLHAQSVRPPGIVCSA